MQEGASWYQITGLLSLEAQIQFIYLLIFPVRIYCSKKLSLVQVLNLAFENQTEHVFKLNEPTMVW